MSLKSPPGGGGGGEREGEGEEAFFYTISYSENRHVDLLSFRQSSASNFRGGKKRRRGKIERGKEGRERETHPELVY